MASRHYSQTDLNNVLTPTFSLGSALTVSGAASASGAINLTSTAHGLVTPTTPYSYLWAVVYNVGGTVEANGLWAVTIPDANHITLTGSTFTNTYTSGGHLEVVAISAGLVSTITADQHSSIGDSLSRTPAQPGTAIGSILAIAP